MLFYMPSTLKNTTTFLGLLSSLPSLFSPAYLYLLYCLPLLASLSASLSFLPPPSLPHPPSCTPSPSLHLSPSTSLLRPFTSLLPSTPSHSPPPPFFSFTINIYLQLSPTCLMSTIQTHSTSDFILSLVPFLSLRMKFSSSCISWATFILLLWQIFPSLFVI